MSTRTPKTHLTVAQAAREIGITPGRLLQMIRAGECEADKFESEMFPAGYAYEVPIKEIDRLSNVKHSRGRPRTGDC